MTWSPVPPDELPGRVASWLAAGPGLLRVAVDGPPATCPGELASALVEPLRALGRPAVVVAAELFWRDASLRFEPGREDVGSYRSWLDADALRREVLDPAVTSGWYLPSLRDPRTNRSTREPRRALADNAVLIVAGSLLLDRGLPFDRTVHLVMAPAALEQRTPPDDRWTLPAYAGDEETAADVIIRADRRPPAVRGLP